MERDPEHSGEVGKPNYDGAPMLGQILVWLFGADGSVCTWTRRTYEFNKEGAERVAHCIAMRYTWHALLYTLVPWLVFLATYVLITQFGAYLDRLGYEWIWWVVDNGAIGGFLLVSAHAVPPTITALLVFRVARRKMRAIIRDHLTIPKCIYCGFDLSGNNPSGDTITCTECGNTTPMALEE